MGFIKDPEAILQYEIDYTKWLGSSTISVSTWTVPSNLANSADLNTSTSTFITLSGGTLDHDYEVINHITTNNAFEDERILHITIEKRPKS